METTQPLNTTPEIWQVEVNGQVYETDLEEMTQWIAEGSLLPIDRVRRGNLRWLEANKVPVLYGFFNAKALGIEPPKISTTINQPNPETTQPIKNNPPTAHTFVQNTFNTPNIEAQNSTHTSYQSHLQPQTAAHLPPPNSCTIHPGEEPKFSCETCLNLFCKTCPSTYGSVKICPMCGAMCQPLAETQEIRQNQAQFHNAYSEGFGFSDFGKALAFPFKYKTSLIAGAIMFMFFTLGQSASAIGGIFMVVAAIFCAMMANTLTFGILANTVENFSQGKIETNFMPSFDDFNLWDDVIHPFFLSIGVYISTFGPLIVLILVVVFFLTNSAQPEMNSLGQKTVATTAPELQADYADASQTGQIKGITDKVKDINNQHNQEIENVEKNAADVNGQRFDEEKHFRDLNDQINQARKKQLESSIGKSPETEQSEFNMLVQNILSAAIPFLFLGGLALLWAFFYFPAACCVAGYTRNFGSTVNPMVGIDTIKRMGTDYVKVLGMGLLISIFSLIMSGVLKFVLSPFNLPRMGNLPAIVIGSFVTFYFSIVFSVILGYALYKNSDKLNLYR